MRLWSFTIRCCLGLSLIMGTSPGLSADSTAMLLPVLYDTKEFKLTDQQGRDFTSTQLKGRVWVASFIYTSCGHECPLMTQAMKRLQDKLNPDGAQQFGFVSITTDPKRDKPEVLRKYMAKMKVNDANWWFLTGDKKQIVAIATETFKLPADIKSKNHSEKFVLVDTSGMVRGYYESSDRDAMSKLERDARDLAKKQ